jgi:hypothetical protein
MVSQEATFRSVNPWSVVKPVLLLPDQANPKPTFALNSPLGAFSTQAAPLPGQRIPKGTQISICSYPDQRWAPQSTPQGDRLYHFCTESTSALYAGLLVLFHSKDVRGGTPTFEAHWGRGPFKTER